MQHRRILLLLSLAWLAASIPMTVNAAVKIQAAGPVKITIPAIHVSAVVESVGLNGARVMRPPSSGSRVAWFNRGPFPGQPGSSVMYGHVSGQHFEPMVFTNLKKLKPGNLVKVTDQRGNIFTYKVHRTAIYRVDTLTYDLLAPLSRFSHLNLYTCAGKWDARKHRYTHYQVVYTDLVSAVAKSK